MQWAHYRCQLLLGLLLAAGPGWAQRVGLVLSGGGAKGLAHIGVLKQLEKNHIPIDYIVGTSMGAVIGGMYAAGYSPQEIEVIARSPAFQTWITGKPPQTKTFNYLTGDPSPAILRLSLLVDSALVVRPRAALTSDLGLNFALARLLAPAGARAGYDFDHLFVPFRSLAAEVFTRQQVVQRAGSLADAVRNSMAVPLAFRAIRNPDGRYLFDGGLYNNFPTDVMRREFAPDILIGVNVGDVVYPAYPRSQDDALLGSILSTLGFSGADTLSVGPQGILIAPNLKGFGAADFARVEDLIALGDTATARKMAVLKQRIARRASPAAVRQRRQQFVAGAPALRFADVRVQGLRDDQNAYARQFFQRRGPTYTLAEVENGYDRLVADDYFQNVYPRMHYEAGQPGYVLSLDARRGNKLAAEVGLLIASRPLENLYAGAEYRYLRRQLYSVSANVSLGRFYNGVQGSLRVTVPGRLPFYIEPELIHNRWNYQNAGGLLGRDARSTQVQQQDTKLSAQIGTSPHYRSRLLLSISAFSTTDHYANLSEISSGAVLDESTFRGLTAALQFARSTLNRKQYATAGGRVVVALRGVSGEAIYAPGTDALVAARAGDTRRWVQLRATAERYFPLRREGHAWGYFLELTASSQGPFATYRASLAAAPVFAPLPDSRTLFLDAYRSTRYVAAGLRYSRPVLGKVEWRTELFAHLNAQPLRPTEDQQAERLGGLERPRLTASTGLVWQTPVGPLALHARFYDDAAARFGVYGHLGYLLFRARALE